MLAPVVILTIWGSSYVWSCVLALSAPGRPVEFKYKSPGGTLTLKADSYAVDWDRGTARVVEPRLYGPDGTEIAAAESVVASGIQLPQPRSIAAHVRNARGRITRLESGLFDIQDFIPEREGPPSDIAFVVDANRAELLIVDLAGKQPYRQRAIASGLEVRGIGDRWIANTSVDLIGIGNLRAEVQSTPNEGFLIQGRTAGLRLAGLLRHIQQTPDIERAPVLKDIGVESLEAVGPVTLFIPKNAAFQVQSRLKAFGRGVRFREYAADEGFFDGQVSQTEVRGELAARSGATKAEFNGSLVWREGVVLGGSLAVTAPSRASLPVWSRELIPQEIEFSNASFNGWLDFREREGVRIQSGVEARQATLYDQRFEQPRLSLVASPEQLRVGVVRGSWAGTPIQGAVMVGISTPSLTGALTAKNVNLATVAQRFNATGLSGKADVSVLLGGTRTAPTAILQARGDGSYRVNGAPVTGRFQAAGRYDRDILTLDRLRVGSSAGSARAIGTVSLKNRTMRLTVDVTNVQLEKLRQDLAGNINASGVLQGPLADPRFEGRAMALGVQAGGQEIPFAAADVTGGKNRIMARNLQVVKGTGEARGEIAIDLRTRGLSGSLSAENVLLNEYLGDEALGTVSIPKLTLSGTLDDPRAAGTASGTDLVLGGIHVDQAEIVSSLKGTVATIDSLQAKVGEGTLSASGRYDYRTKTGRFDAKAENLALARITPPGKGSANVTGVLNGTASGSISESNTIRGRGTGTLQNVVLNDTEFGSGNWSLGYDGETVTGSASIGKLDRFLLLENFGYNTASEFIRGDLSVLNGSIQDFYTSTRPFFPDLSYEVRQRLETAQGDLDTTISVSGPLANPNVQVSLLEARNLALQGQPLGNLNAAFNKTADVWNIAVFRWITPLDEKGMQSTLLLNPGAIDMNGDLLIDGEISNFDLRYVGLIDQSWARVTGYASSSFLVTGSTRSPSIRASMESTKGSEFTVGTTGETFRVNLSTIRISEAVYAADGTYTGGITANGKFFYRGFAGDIVANVPLNYPFEIPDGPVITASLTIPNVQLSDLKQYAAYLDTERSIGNLQGQISIVGPKSDLALRGLLSGTADTLAFTGLETTLTAAVAKVTLQENRIELTFDSTSSAGGTLSAALATTLPDLGTTLDQIAKGDNSAIVRAPVRGSVTATDFAVRQNPKDRDLGAYHARVNSKLDISGPASEPLIKGRVGISDTNILLPSVFEGAGPGSAMLFNPRFEIPIELDEVARFRASAADVSLVGGGVLTGSLARPDFAGTLTLQSGRLNLPTARITLEEGGTFRPSYRVTSTGDTAARVDVNLEGRTTVTAVRFGDTVERYEVRLSITGDLLTDSGLNLNATSDPPGLSKDEILALLGQTDVLQTIGSSSGLSQAETERRIRDALVSIAVPTLTQSLTSQIASNLGLEYFNIDYNAIEGASLSFAKVLGKGLILQGRRQVSPTVGDRKIDYDLRVTYRLPTRNAQLNRFVFSVGLDQDRPWKLGLEYGFRF